MKSRDLVTFVDSAGYVHDAAVVSVIGVWGAVPGALTLTTLDDGVEHSNVQHADERPAPTDIRVTHGHIDGGHWRAATEQETARAEQHAARRSTRDIAFSKIDVAPKKGETPEETARRLSEARTAIYSAHAEPDLVIDETPWIGEVESVTEKRIAAAKKAQAERA